MTYEYEDYLSDHFPIRQGSAVSWNIMTQCAPTVTGYNNGFGKKEIEAEYKTRLTEIARNIGTMAHLEPTDKILLQECPISKYRAEFIKSVKDHLPKGWMVAEETETPVHQTGTAPFGNLTIYNSNKLTLDSAATNKLRAAKLESDVAEKNPQSGRTLAHVFTVNADNTQQLVVNTHHEGGKDKDHLKDIQIYKDLAKNMKLVMGGDFNTPTLEMVSVEELHPKFANNTSFAWEPTAKKQGALKNVDYFITNDENSGEVTNEIDFAKPLPTPTPAKSETKVEEVPKPAVETKPAETKVAQPRTHTIALLEDGRLSEKLKSFFDRQNGFTYREQEKDAEKFVRVSKGTENFEVHKDKFLTTSKDESILKMMIEAAKAAGVTHVLIVTEDKASQATLEKACNDAGITFSTSLKDEAAKTPAPPVQEEDSSSTLESPPSLKI